MCLLEWMRWQEILIFCEKQCTKFRIFLGGPGPTPGTTTRGGGGGGGGGDGGSGSSVGGAVFLGLFFGLLVVYFVGFALYNRVQLNKSGLEVIPHRGFWSGFGGYVAEGFRFTFHKITGKGQYQSV